LSAEPRPSQTVAAPATNGSGGDVSQLSQSQPEEFPVEVLPERVLSFVWEAAEALGVDLALVAGPCLAALAGCIGNRRRIVVKPGGWAETPVLWIVIVQPSGSKKTPALKMVLDHLQKREAAEVEAEEQRRSEYEEELERWRSAPKNGRGEPPEKPEPARRLLVSDVTTEGLLFVHARAPLGLLLFRDELGGWLRSFNQYKSGGQGGDAQTWTEMHQGGTALVDRKHSPTVSVPRAAVSIVGGIQPELLRSCLSGEHLFDGIASRILFVAPPERMKKWTDATVRDESREGWTALLDEILALQADEDGTPIDLHMTAEAKVALVEYYNEHARREAKEGEPMRATMSKLEATTARLALVIQLATYPQSTAVGVDAMKAAIVLSNWFEGQARRVYQGFEESEQEQDRRAALEWIADQGGKTTRRELTRLGPYRLRPRAQEVLDDLEAAGLVKLSRRSGQRGGEYVLCDCCGFRRRRPPVPTEGDHWSERSDGWGSGLSKWSAWLPPVVL
jgi:hypothetical protein